MNYLFLDNGFEEIEALTTVDLLRRANIELTTVSMTGEKHVTGAHQITDGDYGDLQWFSFDRLRNQPKRWRLFDWLRDRIQR